MKELNMKFDLRDWRFNPHKDSNIDFRPWESALEVNQTAVTLQVQCPDGTNREIWIEVSDDNLVAHCYDGAHDEPISVRIGKTDVTIDSDR